MTELPPLMRDQRKIDADQLRLLSLFHFVVAGFAVIGLGFLFLHWLMMHTLLGSPNTWKNAPNAPNPREFMRAFRWFYLIFGACTIVAGTLNAFSGWLIRMRRARTFSLVVAGLNSMGFPMVTALSVFTFVVLLRDSVVELYAVAAAEKAPPMPNTQV